MLVNEQTSFLEEIVSYVKRVLENRLESFFQQKELTYPIELIPRPSWGDPTHPLYKFLEKNYLEDEEFMALMIALIPHVSPFLIDSLVDKYLEHSGEFPQIGGVRGKNHRSFLPTGETIVFLIAGNDLQKRLNVSAIFDANHFFFRKRILWLEDVPSGEPIMSGKVVLSREYVELFTTGKITPPKYSSSFPAKRISTQLTWESLIVSQETEEKLSEIERWLKHNDWLKETAILDKRIKPGYRALFYGLPGTGKTFAVSILGNKYKRPVYRIDLSQVISKYIGETEKNLSQLFDQAEDKEWILFFDEADALFGKRVNVKEAKDKYANQETAYLLQRIEDYKGLVILATNLKENIDKAFIRRFHSIVHFPFPSAQQRLQLWELTLPTENTSTLGLCSSVQLKEIAQRYKLTGANINNIVQYCCYLAKDKGHSKIDTPTLMQGIQREFEKESNT